MVAFFRSAKVSPETTVRVANINEPGHGDHRGYSGNFMRTAKYTYLNFLFKFFWNFVLRRVAYLYFILISVLQIGTDFSPTGKLTTIGPLSVIILFSMINEFWQDQRRRKADREVNARPSRVLRGGSFVPVKWQDVRVGDVVEVRDGEEFPADLLLISTAKPQGLCYVETSNLDGETNLKIRKAPDATKHLQTAEAVAAMVGRVDYEGPNNRLYVFEGTLSLESGAASGAPTKVPLDVNSVLLRGAQFRNTPFCYGVVLYAGADTKLARNSMQVPFKKSQVEKTINRCMILLFLTLVMLIVASSIMLAVNQRNEDDWYVGADDETTKAFNWIVFLILYNSIVPISLYLGIEMSRGGQAALMEADLGMYWAKTDTPMQFKTSTLNEELGQVEYIFSDKTGTLTQNVMEFKKCSVAGVVYQEAGSLDELPAATEGAEWMSITSRIKGSANGESDPVEDFLKILVACHTVIPEMMPDGKIVYQAASPDEGALVDAVKQMGFEFKARTNTSIMYIVGGKEERELEVHAGRVWDTQAPHSHNRSPHSSPAPPSLQVHAINEFSSARKKMSILVREKGADGSLGPYTLLSKGADDVMFEKLRPDGDKSAEDDVTRHLAHFASLGLRTLVLAKKTLTDAKAVEWLERYRAAATAMSNRDAELAAVASEIERNLDLVGATAVEDKLQEGVPETISMLQRAKIKVWMLTGDKQETAINIGYASKLLTDSMQVLTICGTASLENTRKVMAARYSEVQSWRARRSNNRAKKRGLAIVIDGSALHYCEDDKALRRLFLSMVADCTAVVACRVSPMQKADIVRLVKANMVPQPITLAIGDGANDVSMIQEAHIGIGVSGNEGMQAVRSADYAIAQFAFLQRLLLVHGFWNYFRVCLLILYTQWRLEQRERCPALSHSSHPATPSTGTRCTSRGSSRSRSSSTTCTTANRGRRSSTTS